MSRLLRLVLPAVLLCVTPTFAEDPHVPGAHDAPAAHSAPETGSVAPSADEALQQIIDGNKRFVAGEAKHDHADEARRCDTYTGGQHPIAAVLSCADSRVPVELVFDQGIGDLFVVRVAGNVADTDEIGSIEYGVEHLHIPLIVVVGHSKCGAVTAVVDEAKVGGNLPGLLDNIEPAVARTKAALPGADKTKLVNASIRANVFQSIADLLTHSDGLRDAVKAGRVKIVGGVYDLHAGTFNLVGPHPSEAELLAAEAQSTEPVKPGTGEKDVHAAPKTSHAAPAASHDAPAASHDAPKASHDAPKSSHEAPKTSHDADAHDSHEKAGEPAPKDAHGNLMSHETSEEHADADEHAAPTTQPMTAGTGTSNNWMMLALCLAVSGAGSAVMIVLVSRVKKPVAHAVEAAPATH